MQPSSSPPPVRRHPSQHRSAERVERVLDAAASLLAEGGYEALTMKSLAERADVATGSLYHFFASKQEIVSALGMRYLDTIEGVLRELANRRFRSWERALDAIVDAYVDLYRSDGAFRALWVEQNLDRTLRAADAELNLRIAEGARAIVEPLLPGKLRDPARSFVIVVEVGDCLLDLAFARDPDGDRALIESARKLVRLHLIDEMR